MSAAPWPIVRECYYPTPRLVREDHTCSQCDGSHDHAWVAWHDSPKVPHLPGSSVVGGHSAPGIAVRCRICGGRKCDLPECLLRRWHGGGHDWF